MWMAGVLPKTHYEKPQWQFVVDLWLRHLNRDATVDRTLELLLTSNLHLQHLNVLHVNMQTPTSTAGLLAVTDTLQNIQLDVVTHDAPGQLGVNYRYQQLAKKAKLLQSKNSQRGFRSAIWRLPTEILAEIFLYCIPEDGIFAPEPRLAPMLLTTVCRQWRKIAVDMPRLWCRLRLEVGHGDWQQRAFSYNSYLKRSRGRQLSLTLECHDDDWTELRTLLQPYIDQISILSLGFFSGAGSLAVADFRALKELVIYTDGSDPVFPVANSIAQLPLNMRSLKLMDLWLNSNLLSSFNPIAWARLTNLEIVIDGLNCVSRLLRLCPNLSTLTMIGIFAHIETPEAFVHANLQSLRISGDLQLGSTGDLGLFNDITLPNLRAVEVRNIGLWLHEEFKAFLTRSQCPLESLIFGGGVVTTDQQLAEYVTLLPSLQLVLDPMRSTFYF